MYFPMRRAFFSASVAFAAASTAGCGDWLHVDNPTVVDAAALQGSSDLAIMSLSARQDFAQAYGSLILLSAWFDGEALPADPSPDRNEFARRSISPGNSSLLGEVWSPLSVALVSNENVVSKFSGSPRASSSVDIARAQLYAGYAWELMAEQFCRGTTAAGPALATGAMLDSAVARFTSSLTVAREAQAGPAAGRAEATTIAGAALVGRARAYLQGGRLQQAAADADQVPAGFVANVDYADDASNRARLGNALYLATALRPTLTVAPTFRAGTDVRVPVTPPASSPRPADGITPMWAQAKYVGWASPIRLASRLEADYIAAEARGPDAMLALITARRAANGLPAYSGPADATGVLAELMAQRAMDFFLEGKRLGDFRRHPDAVAGMPAPGAPYFRAGSDPIGDQACYPLPLKETQNNPNLH